MENLNEVRVKELRSYNETEFRNHILEELCDEKGISQNFSSLCILEQNGVAKKRIRTLIEATRTISPDVSYFHVFGCLVFIHNHKDHLGKFDEKANNGFFLGYSLVVKAFKMDVKSAFLNKKLPKEVYVQQPPGFESSKFPNYVCKLDKAPSGLKQANRAWYETLTTFLIKHKFVKGFQIKQDSKGISICQEKYVKDLLKKYELADCASMKCPMLPLNILGPDESGVSVNETRFRGTIGSLMFLTASRPAVQFSTCLCARYQANPKESHLVAVKKIRYLKGTPNLGLWYPKGSGFDLKAYSDSDYASCNLDRKSTSGFVKSMVESWCVGVQRSKTQWLCHQPKLSMLPLLDVVLKYHFIRDHILKGDIELHFVSTDLQLAEIFTKPLAEPSFTRLVAELGMLNNDKVVPDKAKFLSDSLIWGLNVDIGNIIFSDLVAKLHNGKKGREPKTPSASKVALTSHMLKVAQISKEPEETLILPSKGVNTSNIINKSLSGTTVQLVSQSKASTDKRSKKKKNPSSFDPKTSKIEHEKIVEEAMEDPLAIDSGIKSLGNVTFDELFTYQNMNVDVEESPFETGSEIKFIGIEADCDLESMPDDEIMSVLRNEEEDDDFEELSQADEIAADMSSINWLYGRKKHSQDAIAQQLPDLVTDTLKDTFLQALTNAFKDTLIAFKKQIKKTIRKEMPKVVLKPLNKEFNAMNKLESERLVIFEKQLGKSIRKKLIMYIEKMLHSNVKVSRDIMVFNAQHLQTKVENTSRDLLELVELTRDIVRLMDPVPASTLGEQQFTNDPASKVSTSAQGEQIPITFERIHFEQFIANLFSSSSSKFSPTPPPKMANKGKGIAQSYGGDKLKQLMPFMEEGGFAPGPQNLHQFSTAGEGPLTLEEAKFQMQEIKRLADLKAEKEKSEKKLKMVLTPEQRKAQKEELAAYEAKRAKMMDEYNHCITFRDDLYQSPSSATGEWLELHALASKRQSASNDKLLKNLKAKFQWVATQAGKLGIPPPPELTSFELQPADKKRKRRVEVIQEVFIKDNVVVDGMHWNLVSPAGVVGSHELVINEPESRIFIQQWKL
ncbi:retrovirus-related pol polyprotein from transposon TNT 1-94 [Tanacetum coccineum]